MHLELVALHFFKIDGLKLQIKIWQSEKKNSRILDKIKREKILFQKRFLKKKKWRKNS